uniref:Uncharacterized protein n=1 Tax=Romanomermis culicivorax TaxID=13658 RepID=A0A915L7W1_ROMCU
MQKILGASGELTAPKPPAPNNLTIVKRLLTTSPSLTLGIGFSATFLVAAFLTSAAPFLLPPSFLSLNSESFFFSPTSPERFLFPSAAAAFGAGSSSAFLT